MLPKILFSFLLLGILKTEVSGEKLYCYRCSSNEPGCGTPFNWLWHWSKACPKYDDRCVKIIERKGSEEIITRECLSSFEDIRVDIPADKYEGCRPAAKDVKLAHYVNNSITELDIYRNYYDNVTWCFCYFDNRCNSASGVKYSVLAIGFVALTYFIMT